VTAKISALIQHVFTQETAATLSEELVEVLCAYEWPGNIRQLRNVLRGMIARRTTDRLDLSDLPSDYGLGARRPGAQTPALEADCLNALAKAERDALLRELEAESGNISHVAGKLGVSRNALYRKMHRLGIRWPLK